MEKKTNVPKLRFPEFEGEWVEKKLGEITYKVGTKNKDGIQYPIYSINNKEGFVPQSDQFDGMDSNKRGYDISLYKIVERNTFAYNPSRINVGSIGYSGNLDKVIVSSLYVCFKTVDRIDDYFMLHFVNTDKFNNSVLTNVEGGVREYLFYENFSNIKIDIPSLPEQTKIASFLTAVDDKLTQLKNKKNLLEEYKKGVMQKIFSQELRFKDDNGEDFPEWEEKRLGEVGEIINGLTYSPEDISPNGVLVLRSSNIKGSNLSFEDKVFVDKLNYNPVIENDILICVRNGSKSLIGKNALIKKENEGLAFGAFMSVFRSPMNLFIFQLFSTREYYKKVNENLGATINSINNSDLNKFEFNFPSLSEQTKIANFLSAIDEKINHCSKQIERMEDWKKGLLQQMFC